MDKIEQLREMTAKLSDGPVKTWLEKFNDRLEIIVQDVDKIGEMEKTDENLRLAMKYRDEVALIRSFVLIALSINNGSNR